MRGFGLCARSVIGRGCRSSAGAMARGARAGRSGPVKTSGHQKDPSARICKRKGIWKAAMRWKEART